MYWSIPLIVKHGKETETKTYKLKRIWVLYKTSRLKRPFVCRRAYLSICRSFINWIHIQLQRIRNVSRPLWPFLTNKGRSIIIIIIVIYNCTHFQPMFIAKESVFSNISHNAEPTAGFINVTYTTLAIGSSLTVYRHNKITRFRARSNYVKRLHSGTLANGDLGHGTQN